MYSFIFCIVLFISLVACNKKSAESFDLTDSKEKKLTGKDTCDNPDADINCCFVNIPENISNVMNIADSLEKGKRIIIKGQIIREDGTTPYTDVIIYVYHTDDNGYYSKRGDETGFQKWHGYLHGWCKTDSEGRYEIHSIRPGRYPSNNAPAHIHWAIKDQNGKITYLNDFVFSDDSMVTEGYLSYLRLPGDNGIITLQENGGVMEGSRLTVLK
ncbi:MAG: intradiol ring-cleavage dioxygenase [Bacteroidota bacterium]|nr:intradiol ring-cleavage dioxygenase [Bacteroidota bacterium]